VNDEIDHASVVDGLLTPATKGLPAARLLRLFETALDALWKRTQLTLGDVTLTAIVDRVLYNAAEKLPALAVLTIGADARIHWEELQQRADALQPEALVEGIRFTLLEFLTVIGNLTAEILTPDLHAELARLAQENGGRAEEATTDEPPHHTSTESEDTRS